MKESGFWAKEMDSENKYGLIKVPTRVSGRMIRVVGKGS